MHSLTLPATVDHLPEWLRFVATYAKKQGLSLKRIFRLERALEEALANVCYYAYSGEAGEVAVACRVDAQQCFIVEIIDHGAPFDPLSLPEPALEADLEQRQVGGLGVFLVRHLLDDVAYRRENGRNILKLMLEPPEDGVGA